MPDTLPPPEQARLALMLDRLRPRRDDPDPASRLRAETDRLGGCPAERDLLRADLLSLLALPGQSAFYAEAGIQSSLGFGMELRQRIGFRLLPRVPGGNRLEDVAGQLFQQPRDAAWISAVPEADWLALARVLGLDRIEGGQSWEAITALLNAARAVSFRIASIGLDNELLRIEPSLDRLESPFLAQNAEFMPLYLNALEAGVLPEADAACHLPVLLEQCEQVIGRVRRRARDNGTSIHLTYLLARLDQLLARLRLILDVLFESPHGEHAVRLFKTLVTAIHDRDNVFRFVGENVNLLARNVTEHASRHGEHYIAGNRAEWWAMGRAAALGGVIIALMAAFKIQLGHLHLPPLTEGLVFGLNYGLGFALIHMLGGVVATKQPAMTATTLAGELEDARPRELGRLAGLVETVARTQFAAIAGNVLLALPVALGLALAWPFMFGSPLAQTDKAVTLLAELHPWTSGALWYAAVAGVGLFLSGLVAGYYDNKVRYLGTAQRIAQHPWSRRWLKAERRERLASYIDLHHGALMGNLLFGLYLGLAGSVVHLTGLPIDIRHVAFASANLGSALALTDFTVPWPVLAWALAGVIGIGAVNLLVSFALALYVAMRSRRQTLALLPGLIARVVGNFLRRPWRFLLPEAADAGQPPTRPADH